MCKVGDIIVVDKYIGEDGKPIGKHSFIVVNENAGIIEGLEYDFVTNVMSSFKNLKHKTKKLKFRENLGIGNMDIISDIKINNNSGYVKADQLVYFNKSKLNYYVLGKLNEEFLDELIKLIVSLNKQGKLRNNINNIKASNTTS